MAANASTPPRGENLSIVPSNFFHSAESETRLVSRSYLNYLDHVATPAEVSAWIALMQAEMTEDEAAAAFLNANAFNALCPDSATFVLALYRDLLGRAGSATEVASWDAVLAGGTSRATAVAAFQESPFALQRAVEGFATEYAGAPADPAGLSALVSSVIANKTSLIDLAIEFIASPAYALRANGSVG